MNRSTAWSPAHPPGARVAPHHARELARMPAFAACTPRELTRIARWGDVTEVDAGHVIVRENHSDWWFFVVVSGRVTLTKRGRTYADLAPGAHFGQAAILGLRPQSATATATETTVLFVLGPRYALTLLSRSRGFRQAVFPDIAVAQFAEFSRRVHAEGELEWRRLAGTHRPAGPAVPSPRASRRAPSRGADQPPGRPLTLAAAVRALAQLPESVAPAAQVPARARRLRWWLAGGAAVTAGICGVLFGYHPPRLVLTAGRPIDVVSDVRITGATTYPPTGHYLMLWVKAEQPTLAGLLSAWVAGRPTVALNAAADADAGRVGREQYLDSQTTAVRLALAAADVDPHAVSVRIRDRGFAGPSAGLVYALALEDLLTPGDLSAGRTIGVTGGLLGDGSVEPIGWLVLKAQGAVGEHATVLVVPDGQTTSATGYVATTCGAATFRQALEDLLRRGAHCLGGPGSASSAPR